MAAPTGGTNIVIPLQQEQLAVGTQQVPDGSVNIHKEVKNETISQPVQVRREEVVVSHLPPGQTPPGGQGATSNALGAPFQGGQVTIPLSQEKPVVSTQTVPAGNVVIQKRTTTQPQIVQGQVRREEIVTTPTGGAQIAGTSNLPPSSAQGMGAPPSGYGQSGGYGQTGGTSGMAITKPDQLTSAPDPTALVGQKVELSNVKVQKVLGDRLLAVGSETGGPPIYVRTAQPISGINTGQTINVHGIVRQTPSSPSSMGLDQASAQALSGQPIYIDASSVTPSGQ